MGRLVERRRQRDEKQKQRLRPLIAQAVAPVVPAGEQTVIAMKGYVLLPPLHPFAHSMRIRDRLEALWHRIRAYESYIAMTEEYVVVVPVPLGWPGAVIVRIEDVAAWWYRRGAGDTMQMQFPETRHFSRIWMKPSDGNDLWLIIPRPWISEAQALRQALPLG
jgi:hypothetical protein